MCLVHMPFASDRALALIELLQQERGIVDGPTMNGGMVDGVAALGHDFLQVPRKHPRSHADFERRASSGLSYDGECSGGLLWSGVLGLAQSLPFPWKHFMEA